ncbi:MAG: PQQ-like beta-propeller repeat protein [Gemmataceae bacterium]|nr:PQQ-like beta-propeller repeat protein [Gemmataceae bacterium]MCI0741563.1 PQQ-like beta-propeller repeat protein [Gemmataceae bacterium]
MKSIAFSLLMTYLLSPAAYSGPGEADALGNWSQWRGPLGTGVAPNANPPVEWSETKNIRWKTALPGKGHASPVVWGDRIFLLTAIPYGDVVKPRIPNRPGAHDNLALTKQHEYVALAVNRKTGKILWQETLSKGLPHEAGHVSASLASASPVTDGERVYAFFGSRGLYCLDTNGKLVWKKDLGEMHSKHGHGEGSSPALHGETLIVNWDHEEQSFLLALDKRTGKQLWRVARTEDTSWSTPIVVEHGGKAQVIVPGTNRLRGYDIATGAIIWECGGLSSNVVASPVAANGMVFSGSSYETQGLLAIRLDGAKGDITGTKNVLWYRRRGTPYVPSPLLYDNSLYILHHYQGIVSRLDTKTGDNQGGPYRMDGIDSVYSSPVGAAGRIYITSRDGVTQVMSHGEQAGKMLAENRLDDVFSASAALVGRELFLRGERWLYCITEE